MVNKIKLQIQGSRVKLPKTYRPGKNFECKGKNLQVFSRSDDRSWGNRLGRLLNLTVEENNTEIILMIDVFPIRNSGEKETTFQRAYYI